MSAGSDSRWSSWPRSMAANSSSHVLEIPLVCAHGINSLQHGDGSSPQQSGSLDIHARTHWAHLIARPCWLTSAGQIGLHTNRKIMYQLKLLGNTVQSAATVKDSTPYTHVQKQPTMGSLVGVEESAGPLGLSDAGYTRLTQPGRSSVGFSIPFACNNAYVTDSALLPAHTRSVFHHCCRSWEKRSQSDPWRQETEGLPGLFWLLSIDFLDMTEAAPDKVSVLSP